MRTFTILAVNEAYTLRPSLAAAMALDAKHGMFNVLAGITSDWRVGIVRDVIEACAPGLDRETYNTLSTRLIKPFPSDHYVELMSGVALAFVGLDNASELPKGDGKKGGKPLDFKEFYRDLYKLGTGWCGFSPAETLAATPVELRLAYEGKMDMLKALHGVADCTNSTTTPDPTPEQLEFAAVKAMMSWGAKA